MSTLHRRQFIQQTSLLTLGGLNRAGNKSARGCYLVVNISTEKSSNVLEK